VEKCIARGIRCFAAMPKKSLKHEISRAIF
jgi:hypothetical protein